MMPMDILMVRIVIAAAIANVLPVIVVMLRMESSKMPALFAGQIILSSALATLPKLAPVQTLVVQMIHLK